jgi:XTP/dITP diphosphohydrolase
MADFTFVTSNDHKVKTAEAVCQQFKLTFEHKNMDLLEIQSDSGEDIARFKVEQAFKACQNPVAITDDSWLIPGLGGFPGPYMKDVNRWFKPQDFINLTESLADRRMIMHQVIAYKDEDNEKIFSTDIEASLFPILSSSLSTAASIAWLKPKPAASRLSPTYQTPGINFANG